MKKKNIIILAVMLLMPFMAGAQSMKGSYFLDNSVNRNKMNPAFTPRSNYFQIPAVGHLNVGLGSNLDIPTFMYPMNGELVTFLHSSVTPEQFEASLPKHPNMDFEVNTNILSMGFYTKNSSFWTFDLGVKAGLDTDLPADLFLFLKKGTGTSGQSYNIANLNAYANASVQAALGYSRNIFHGFRAGVKFRFIAPVAYAALNLENVRLTTGRDKWTVETEGYAHAALQGLEVNMEDPNATPEVGFDIQRLLSNKVLAGYGYSFDFGVEYVVDFDTIFDGISISAAVTDLGSIHYNSNAVNSFSTKGKVDWVGLQNISMDNVDAEAALEDFRKQAENLLNLKKEATPEKFTRSTMPSVYAGVEVPLLWRRMSVGLLYSGRFSHSYYRQELTASYNLTPCPWFALGVNYSFLNTAQTLGWVLELTPRAGFNIFVGGDYLPMGWAKAPILENFLGQTGLEEYYMLPLSLRFNLQVGVSLALGSKYGKR